MNQSSRPVKKTDEKSKGYEIFDGFLEHQKKQVVTGINCREVFLVLCHPADKSWQKKLPFSLA